MKYVDVTYQPGTTKTPNATTLSKASFSETDKVHFPDGVLRSIPGWFDSTPWNMDFTGGCRTIFAAQMTGTYQGNYYFFGCNNRNYVIKNDTMYNMSPIASGTTAYGTDPFVTRYDDVQIEPFTTASGSNVVTLNTFLNDYLKVGDSLTISGVAATVNGIPLAELNDTHVVTGFNGSNAQITVSTSATSTGSPTLANVVLVAKRMRVNKTSHGLTEGDRIEISGATGSWGGIAASEVNKEHIVDNVVDDNIFSIVIASDATSFASGGGGSVVVGEQIAGGNLDQGTAEGWGAGLWGAGLPGVGTISTSTLSYPRIPSYDVFGNEIVYCPGDYTAGNGQKIYIWDGDTSTAPTALSNAPTDCNFVMVVNNAVVGICADRIDISEIGDGTVWTPGVGTTAYTKTLERAVRVIAGVKAGARQALLFTENEVLILRYVGEPDYWEIDDLTQSDGIIAPNAFCVLDGVVYWMGRRGFYRFTGSYVERIINAQNEDWIFANLNYGQQYKCFVAPDVQHGQVYFHFPVESDECDYYVILNIVGGHWTLGQLSRTAAQHPAFVGSQYYMAYGDAEDSAGTIYRHYVDNPTLNMGWSWKTAPAYAGDGSQRFRINQFVPDSFSKENADYEVQYLTRDYPQSDKESGSPIYTLNGETEYVTVQAAGRVRRISAAGHKQFTLGSWKEEIVMQGRR